MSEKATQEHVNKLKELQEKNIPDKAKEAIKQKIKGTKDSFCK